MDVHNLEPVSIEIDGIYYPACKQLHPTLMWHEKYDNYLDENEWTASHIKALKRFGEECTAERAKMDYADYLVVLGLKFIDKDGKCCVCNAITHYAQKNTGCYTCSDECQYTYRRRVV